MMRSHNLFSPIFIAVLLVLAVLTGCKGGELCGPASDPVTDADGDCLTNEEDNCPLDYNGGQIDLDEDGVGQPCDSDDGDDTVALINDQPSTALLELESLSPLANVAAYVEPQLSDRGKKVRIDLSNKSCAYYLVSCNGRFLGTLDGDEDDENSIANEIGRFGSAGSEDSILNPLSFYGRLSTSCSAFNEMAAMPPAVVCLSSNGNEIIGYLTLNAAIETRIPACEALSEIGLGHPACE